MRTIFLFLFCRFKKSSNVQEKGRKKKKEKEKIDTFNSSDNVPGFFSFNLTSNSFPS